jgi:hypothetical protein
VDAHTFTKQAEKLYTNVVCLKADDNCFLGEERSAEGGIHATGDHNNVRSVFRNIKNYAGPFRRRGMLTYGVVHLHDNARPHKATHTRSLLEHFNWGLSDHPPYSPDLAPSDYHLFTYVKKWLESQRFNDNKELMEGIKTWLS